MEILETKTLIERSIYERLRLVTVELGYTPDITTIPDTPNSMEIYNQRLKEIKEEKGFVIEIFSFSAPRERGLIKNPRITLEMDAFIPGTIGVYPGKTSVLNNDGSYDAYEYDALAYDMLLSFKLKALKIEHFRLLQSLLFRAYRPFSYIPIIGSTEDKILMILTSGDQGDPTQDEGLLMTFHYMVPDILFSTHIHYNYYEIIKELTLNTTISEYLGLSNFTLKYKQ